MKSASKNVRSRRKTLKRAEPEEEEEEEEEDVFIPTQFAIEEAEAEDEKLSSKIERLAAIVKQKRQVIKTLESEATLLDSASRGFHFQIERTYAQRQPVWWWVLVVLSFLCALGMYDKGRYLLAFLALVAHKFLWRSLYVDRNAGMQLFAVVVVVVCFVF